MVQVLERPEDPADKAFRLLAGSMMANPIPQTDAVIALCLLETTLTNRIVPAARHYISELHKLIKQDNALKILVSISRWIYSSEGDHQFNFEPSAPPFYECPEDKSDNWMKEPLRRLRDDILLEIDKQGDYFLKQKEIEDLHYQDLLGITTSDSLQVSNELIVYCAIMRWSVKERQRKALSLEDVNIKAVLDELMYAPRYGLMSKRQFRIRTIEGHRGPDRIGLPGAMNEMILAYITQKDKRNRDKNTEELPYKMSRERTKNQAKKLRPMKEKAILNCLTCFSAVFD